MQRAIEHLDKALDKAGELIAIKLAEEAIKNAPRSPKQSEINRHRKQRREAAGRTLTARQKKAYKKRRKKDATSRAKPGGLERSIEGKYLPSEKAVNIFVAANSEAGKYAAYIHDERYKKWYNRGVGTVNKGERAAERFIERAIKSNMFRVSKQIAKTVGDAAKSLDLKSMFRQNGR